MISTLFIQTVYIYIYSENKKHVSEIKWNVSNSLSIYFFSKKTSFKLNSKSKITGYFVRITQFRNR